MNISLFKNNAAKKHVNQMYENNLPYWAVGWSKEKSVKCYTLSDGTSTKTIILLHRCDYDPRGQHTSPMLIDFIHTFPEFRQQGFAFKILSHIKEREQLSALCSSEASEKLFEKAGFSFKGHFQAEDYESVPLFQFP